MSESTEAHIRHLEELARQSETEREYLEAEQARLRLAASEWLRQSQEARARIEQPDMDVARPSDKRQADANFKRARQIAGYRIQRQEQS